MVGFGAGHRPCIGKRFSPLEMRLFVALCFASSMCSLRPSSPRRCFSIRRCSEETATLRHFAAPRGGVGSSNLFGHGFGASESIAGKSGRRHRRRCWWFGDGDSLARCGLLGHGARAGTDARRQDAASRSRWFAIRRRSERPDASVGARRAVPGGGVRRSDVIELAPLDPLCRHFLQTGRSLIFKRRSARWPPIDRCVVGAIERRNSQSDRRQSCRGIRTFPSPCRENLQRRRASVFAKVRYLPIRSDWCSSTESAM